MKRYYVMLLIFTLCLVVAGCRRGSGGIKRGPVVAANEADVLVPPNDDERIFKTLPQDRKYFMWISTVTELEQEFKDENARKQEIRKLIGLQEEREKDEKLKDKAAADKAVAMSKEARYELEWYAPLVLEFVAEKRSAQQDYSQEKFYTFLRRGGTNDEKKFTYERKFVNKANAETTIEKVRAIKFFEGNTVTFVPDIDPRVDDYVVCHRSAAGGGGGLMGGAPMIGGGAGPGGAGAGAAGPLGGGPGGGGGGKEMVWYNKKNGYEEMPSGNFKTLMKQQDLRLLRAHFILQARAGYLRPPANADETKDLLLVYQNFDAAMDAMVYQRPAPAGGGGGAPFVLQQIAQAVPSLIKAPADAFDPKKFKKYLEDSAPPSVLSKLRSMETAYNEKVDLRDPTAILACRNEMEFITVGNDQKPIGHWVILTTGETRIASTQEIRVFAPAPPAKKEGPIGGGAPPLLPGPGK